MSEHDYGDRLEQLVRTQEQKEKEMLAQVGENRMLQVAEGLKILAKYNEGDFGLFAGHDIIVAGPGRAILKVSLEDRRLLKKLNWHVAGDETEEGEDVIDIVSLSKLDEDELDDNHDGAYYFFP